MAKKPEFVTTKSHTFRKMLDKVKLVEQIIPDNPLKEQISGVERIGLKNIDEIWKELRDLSLHMPILHQGFRLQKEFKEDISDKYLLASMCLILAKELNRTQGELIKAVQMKAP